MFCSKQEDVGDERRLKPLAEEKKLVLQSSAEPVEMNGGQGRGEKGSRDRVPPRSSARTQETP